MKPYKVLIFILLSFSLLALLGFAFPKEGITLGKITLRFPSPADVLALESTENVMDIEKNIHDLQDQTNTSNIQSLADSLTFYKKFVTQNVSRIYFPKNNYTFFDPLFATFEKSKNEVVNILHYGDSQIEMDRISSLIRQRVQERFGGMGVGIIPPIQTIPTFSLWQSYSGNLQRYVVYGDTSQPRASHRRYGILGSFAQLNGSASISFAPSNSKRAHEKVKTFQQISLILGNNQGTFTATCRNETKTIKDAKKGVSVLTWNFSEPISKASLTLSGTAEIYGIAINGKSGLSFSNIPMRGCSGTIFTRIDSANLSQSYKQMNVALIIMQFGGNMMPQINSEKAITRYMDNISRQIKHIKKTNPNAFVLFIGPSDMSKRINGKLQSYPYLKAMNQELKKTVLANNAAYWDMFEVMGGENSMIEWVKHVPAWASSDYIHFTEAGALEIATVFSNALLTHYDFYQLRKKCSPGLIEKFMNLN